MTDTKQLAGLLREAAGFIDLRMQFKTQIAEDLREAADELEARKIKAQGWYCEHCQRGVDNREVTYSEQHGACGRYIANDTLPAPQPDGGG